MAESVDLPAIGNVKKEYIYGGVALVAGIVGFAWWKRRTAPATPAYAADPTNGTDSVNPNYRNPNPTYTSSPDTAKLPPTTDQEWSQRVLASLNWLEPGYLGGILGKYLGSQGLTLEEQAVVRAAWAIEGRPPSNKPIIADTGSGTPGGTPGTVNPPLTAPGNVNVTISGTRATASWPSVPGAEWYVIFYRTPHGSTGGYDVQATSHGADLILLNVNPGEWIEAEVYARKSAGERGPATLSNRATR